MGRPNGLDVISHKDDVSGILILRVRGPKLGVAIGVPL